MCVCVCVCVCVFVCVCVCVAHSELHFNPRCYVHCVSVVCSTGISVFISMDITTCVLYYVCIIERLSLCV